MDADLWGLLHSIQGLTGAEFLLQILAALLNSPAIAQLAARLKPIVALAAATH
jgi:hypothetical protein